MKPAAILALAAALLAPAADLSTKKALNLAVIKQMAATVEAEAQKRNVKVTVAIVDESGNLLFLQKMDGAGLNTIEFAQRKARHSALYRSPSKVMADRLKSGDTGVRSPGRQALWWMTKSVEPTGSTGSSTKLSSQACGGGDARSSSAKRQRASAPPSASMITPRESLATNP